jgi:hypothetical protein
MDVIVAFRAVGREFIRDYNEFILTQSACSSHLSCIGLSGD